jgi:hypothetical protein
MNVYSSGVMVKHYIPRALKDIVVLFCYYYYYYYYYYY